MRETATRPLSGTSSSAWANAPRPLSEEHRHTVTRYDRRAEQYEQRWSAYLEHTHRRFLQHMQFGPEDRLLDLSCGTGLLASELLESGRPFRHLTLNDPSRGMLDHARRRLPDSNNLEFTSQPAHRFPFGKERFDAIFILNSFHFYPHQREVVEGMREGLAPGGTVCILDWNRSGLFRATNALISLVQTEYIDTRSLDEAAELLERAGLVPVARDEWYFRYWNLFYLEARKQD